ncbi:MAG: aminopeptidase [Candidatus Thermoplasmatota archaeon]|nr:aminopeptidase [Candidatus Thermoplasmatota archaeon]
MVDGDTDFEYKKKSSWDIFSDEQIDSAFDFCNGYISFLSKVKTEREAVDEIKKIVESKKKKLFLNKHAGAAVVAKGSRPISEGVRLIISHMDSPRLDLKQVPLFEDGDCNLALLETHYYGGIKKFQWLTIPLALHGVVVKQDGSKINLSIGEKPDDPVFCVPDLLPHLSHEVQDNKKLRDAIQGESLDIAIGNRPFKNNNKDDEKKDGNNKLKKMVLQKLHEEYGLVEEDFVSADIEAVPAYQPREIGFDRALIGGYGQDDRVCVYTSLQAIMDVENPVYTSIALFVDKEEIGSEGNTSAQAMAFLRLILKQLDSDADIDKVMMNSQVISADVDAAVTPNYKQVFELKNASSLGNGVGMSKYTGHGGKYSANDAPAEYVGEIRSMLNSQNIPWQTGELGKVDKGGGGTVAKYFSRMGMNVIDLGPPVLSMHAPFEITSKLDVYAAYLAYKKFLSSE